MQTSDGIPPATVIRAGTTNLNEWTAGEFRSRLRNAPSPGTGPVIVDLTGVRAMDWTTLGEIAGTFRRCQAAGREFGVVCGPGPIRDMFAVPGADKVMDIASSADQLAFRQRELPLRAGGSRPADGPAPTVSVQVEAMLRPQDEPALKIPMTVGLLYDASDPYAVKASFHVSRDEQREWWFARDLLRAGLEGPAGSCDVRICPLPRGVLGVGLISPYGKARFDFDAREVDDFVTAAYRLVPEGCEGDTAAEELDRLFLPGGAFGEGRTA